VHLETKREMSRVPAASPFFSPGAAHGHYSKRNAELFQQVLGGQLIKLRNLDVVPGLLMDAIRDASN
jgi:hypothetical protein